MDKKQFSCKTMMAVDEAFWRWKHLSLDGVPSCTDLYRSDWSEEKNSDCHDLLVFALLRSGCARRCSHCVSEQPPIP